MAAAYWLYEWLDAYGVKELADAERLLRDPRTVESLRDHASSGKNEPPSSTSILAGAGIDLSGQLGCMAPECRRADVAKLFTRAWHYFDRIVVNDAVAHELTDHASAPSDRLREWLVSHIDVALYLRQLGAEHLVEFRTKPTPCETHWEQHAREAGLANVVAIVDDVAGSLESVARVEFSKAPDGCLGFAFSHPHFEHTVWRHLPASLEAASAHERQHAAAVAVVHRYLAYLASDARAAREAGTPLATTTWLHGKLLDAGGRRPVDVPEVAFSMDLPVIRGVPLDVLLRLRHDEKDSFERFRSRLTLAIKERVHAAPSSRAAELGREIVRDVVDPELRLIEGRLRVAEKVLAKKAVAAISLGVLTTTCGLIAGAGAGAAVLAGVAAMAAGGLQAADKHVDSEAQVQLADMYFLWNAAHNTHG